MKIRALASTVILLFLAASNGFSQDLVEAARKERERRATFKNKVTAVLTNDTLARLNKKPAVTTSQAEAEAAERPESGQETEPLPSESSTAASIDSPLRSPRQVTVVQAAPIAGQDAASPAGAESRWQKAKEYADLLELKLNALWQEFYSMDDMTSRDSIQQEISQTFEKYTKAREEEAAALADLEKEKGRKN